MGCVNSDNHQKENKCLGDNMSVKQASQQYQKGNKKIQKSQIPVENNQGNQGQLQINQKIKQSQLIEDHKNTQGDQQQINLKILNKIQVNQPDFFLLKQISLIHKELFIPNIYLWIDENIHNPQNQYTLLLLKKQGFDPILYQNIQEAKSAVMNNKNNSKFRIITSSTIIDSVCNQFKSNQKVVHIYIYGGQIGESLKRKERKIKFYAKNVEQFIKNITQQSHYDNKFLDLPNFLKITNKNSNHDNTLINKSRYNLHGLFRFKNRTQAKQDFVKFVKYFYSIQDKAFKYDIKMFQDEYPVQLNYTLALNWYTRPTFFYGFLNNMLRTTSNPLQTAYLRLPFESTFKAIKALYDQTQKRCLKVYRGGFINNQQLNYLEQNVGEYIQMYGFMSTSEDYDIATSFLQRYHGNSLITIVIQTQDRQSKIDYGYISLVEYSDLPSQKEVLFNCLNVFKIISFTRQDGINSIKLKYGQLSRMVKCGQERALQKQKNIIYNYKYQQEIISNCFNNQGDVLNYCQMYDNQIQYRLKYLQNKSGQSTIDLAYQLHKTGSAYYNKSQYHKALQYYQRSLLIKINMLGQDNTSVVETLNKIGLVYDKKAEYDKALKYYQRSLKIIINTFGQNHSIVPEILNNIGIVYRSKAEYDQALEYHFRSLNINISLFGENHIITAETLQYIGLVYYRKGQFNNALENQQRSLKIKMNTLGEYHSSTANTIQNIGLVYRNKADYDKALQYHEKSLKIVVNILGENHNSTADTLNNIGLVYYMKDLYDKALEYYQRSLKINIDILGENHRTIALISKNIGSAFEKKTQYDMALKYYYRSLKITQILGEDQIDVLKKIGLVYIKKDDFKNAESFFQRSLKAQRNKQGVIGNRPVHVFQNIIKR